MYEMIVFSNTNNMKKYYLFIVIMLIIISYKMIYIYSRHEYYFNRLIDKTTITVLGSSAPRGRILDTNGKILVDNKPIKAIFFNKLKGITLNDEIMISNSLAKYLDVKEASIIELKKYYLANNSNGKDLITKEEYDKLQKRKISSKELYDLKLSRISDDMLNAIDKKAAYIYSLIKETASYQKVLLQSNVKEEVYAKVVELNLKGITGELTWERYYPYGDTLKDIFGRVGSIPKELKDEYLNKGYSLNDLVGISYLEYEYEEYLKGEKAIYKVVNNSLVLEKEEIRGNDLVLAIDIELQEFINNTLKEILLDATKHTKTDYYKESYVLVGNPNNGEIMAVSGIRINKDNTFSDISLNNINKSWTMGSAVKGATIAVGYKYNLINGDKKITDSCVKLENLPLKCSYKRLGKINDLTALEKSSNYYQYLIAIKSTGNEYKYNMKLDVTEDDFNRYRDILKSFGLGTLTNIDLPFEKIGIIGSKIAPDLLLNLAIGQYDTYTPIEMLQYINSVATGMRMSLSLMRNITAKEDILLEHDYTILNEIPLKEEYLNRIREGMRLVLSKGTGRYHVPQDMNFAGKTGTSESFLDSNNDGIIDIATITKTFVGFYPYDNPKYSLVVITPNISINDDGNYVYNGNSKITKKIATYLKFRDF